MKTVFNRRRFIRDTSLTVGAIAFSNTVLAASDKTISTLSGRIGIIGLDTSHSVAFTKSLNGINTSEKYNGFRIVAAYPQGSADIESSVKRIPGYIEEVKKMGVEIVNSIQALLEKVDYILLETNDGRPHLDQALQVIKAGKTLFIDKPVAGTLHDTIAIYKAAKENNVPIF